MEHTRAWRRWTSSLTTAEWRRLGGFASAIALLNVVGWGLFLYYARDYPALAGLGTLAFAFGLRHAFDADHIAAIDNTTRKLLQDGKRPLGVGFFFSLGHSTIVFALTAVLAVATRTVNSRIPTFQDYGGYIGATVSGTFLWIIGILNLIVLLDIVRIFRRMRTGSYDERQLEQRLLERGFMNRFGLGRLAGRINASWKMYPLGVLFGLGFDTATEVGLLAVAAGVATHQVPFLAVLSLPILFAAGMCLMDTADGAFMSQAYGWAFSNPIRKVYYNITVTSLSVAVALIIGTIELLQVFSTKLALSSGFWGWLNNLDFGKMGYAIVATFVLAWSVSILVWKRGRIEERWGKLVKAEEPSP
ncbi:MAG: HoxN/HupN/NixA family nickel/cobalt transporter [Candidatus Rokuibacteriota bacterium]|nr:MAG: HoxN/HupN/NixA family nickel/cobalt transporter [Candidatus Rokubacteria bacterium]